MPDETILVWFRFSTQIEYVPVAVSAYSNWIVKFLIMSIFSFKNIIP